MVRFLTGKDYPHLCKTCRAVVDNCAMILTEGGPDTDNVEAPSDMAYDQHLFCGGHCCLGPWKQGQVVMFDGIHVTLKMFTGGGFWIAVDEHGGMYYPHPDDLSLIPDTDEEGG